MFPVVPLLYAIHCGPSSWTYDPVRHQLGCRLELLDSSFSRRPKLTIDLNPVHYGLDFSDKLNSGPAPYYWPGVWVVGIGGKGSRTR